MNHDNSCIERQLIERVDRLEKQNRNMKIVTTVFILAFLSIFVMGQVRTYDQIKADTVTAKAFHLVGDGTSWVVFQYKDGDPTFISYGDEPIVFFDKKIKISDRGISTNSLEILYQGEKRARLSSEWYDPVLHHKTSQNPALEFYSNTGRTIMMLGYHTSDVYKSKHPALALYESSTGEPEIELGFDICADQLSGLSIRNKFGNDRVVLADERHRGEKSMGYLSLSGPNNRHYTISAAGRRN